MDTLFICLAPYHSSNVGSQWIQILADNGETVQIRDHLKGYQLLVDSDKQGAIISLQPMMSSEKFYSIRENVPQATSIVLISYELTTMTNLVWVGIKPKQKNLVRITPAVNNVMSYWISKDYAKEILERKSHPDFTDIILSSSGLMLFPGTYDPRWAVFSSPADDFPEIYCINLASSVDRKERMIHRFERLNLMSHVHFIDAISSTSPEVQGTFPAEHGLVSQEELKYYQCVYGCYQSHFKAIEKFLLSGEESAIICEDDALFHNDFLTKAKEIFDNVPKKVTLVMLGWQTGMFQGFSWAGREPSRKNLARILPDRTWNTICYWISREYAAKIYQQFHEKPILSRRKKITPTTFKNGLIDNHSAEDITRRSKGYITIPPLVLAECLSTTIRHTMPSEDYLFNLLKGWGFENYLAADRDNSLFLPHLNVKYLPPPLEALLGQPNRTFVTVLKNLSKQKKKLKKLLQLGTVIVYTKKGKKTDHVHDHLRVIYRKGLKDKFKLLEDALMFNPFNSSSFVWLDFSRPVLLHNFSSVGEHKIHLQSRYYYPSSSFSGSTKKLLWLCQQMSIKTLNILPEEKIGMLIEQYPSHFGSDWLEPKNLLSYFRENNLFNETLRIYPQLKDSLKDNYLWYYEELLVAAWNTRTNLQEVAEEFHYQLVNYRHKDFIREFIVNYQRIYTNFEYCLDPPGKRIAILCSKRNILWDSSNNSVPHLVHLAHELSKLNCQVQIYGNPGKYSPWRLKISNPRYYDYESFPKGDYEKYDFIILEDLTYYDQAKEIAETLLFWPQDLLKEKVEIHDRLDGVLWISSYQRDQYCQVDPRFSSYPETIYGYGLLPVSLEQLVLPRKEDRSCLSMNQELQAIWEQINPIEATLTIVSPKEKDLLPKLETSSFWLQLDDDLFPSTLLQAQLAGCVPILAANEKLKEFLPPKSRTSSMEEYSTLLEQVLQIEITPEERKKHQQFAQRWNWKSIAEQILQDYSTLDLKGFIYQYESGEKEKTTLPNLDWPPFSFLDPTTSLLDLVSQLLSDTEVKMYLIITEPITFSEGFSSKLEIILSQLTTEMWDFCLISNLGEEPFNPSAKEYALNIVKNFENSKKPAAYLLSKDGARLLESKWKEDSFADTSSFWNNEILRDEIQIYRVSPPLVYTDSP